MRQSATTHLSQWIPAWMLLAALTGCASRQPDLKFAYLDDVPAELQTEAQKIAEHPQDFLRESLEQCDSIETYEVDFLRQERRGFLVKEVREEERMHVLFRSDPYSVKMIFLDPGADFSELVYVAGKNNDRVRCQWSYSLLPGQPPPVNDYTLEAAVQFGRSRNPVTDFGIARLMEKIVAALDHAISENAPPAIEYLGVTPLEDTEQSVHHVQLHYSSELDLENHKVDLMFHVKSLLPAACYLWETEEKLNARYVYTDFNLNPDLTEEHFKLSVKTPDNPKANPE